MKIQKGALLATILGELNAVAIDTIAGKSTFLIYYSDPLPVDSVVELLEGDPDVIYAQPNFLCAVPEIGQISQSFPDENKPVYISGVSPDLYYDQQGAIIVSADSANLISTGDGVTVAVIDNGIDYNHPLFENSISASGFDFIDNDDYPAEEIGGLLGHGTFVSGLIKRIAPDCIIMPLRAFDAEGLGSSFKVAEAIYWAIDNGAGVINMSFSMSETDPVIYDAVSVALEANLALAASPGNDGQELTTYPAAYTGVIAISAIDSLDYIAPFSNYGNYI
ncbi:MAG: S8 family serine peptidase, partial [Candidatus Zixiibacteriota bacterium]